MTIEGFKKTIDRVISFLLIVTMVALVVCVVWQVMSRYILLKPSTLTDELARFLMIWVGLLGAAYAVGLQKHLAIDLLIIDLPKKKKLLIDAAINLIVMIFCLSVVVFGGVGLVANVLKSNQMAPALQIPMGYVYLILPLSGVIMTYYSVIQLIADLVAWRRLGGTAPTNNPVVEG